MKPTHSASRLPRRAVPAAALALLALFAVLTSATPLGAAEPVARTWGDPARAWRQAARDACAAAAGGSTCAVSGFERRPLAGDVVEYRATLRVGPGEHDRIGLHRVVRERAP